MRFFTLARADHSYIYRIDRFRYDSPDYDFYESYIYAFSFLLPFGIICIPLISLVEKKYGVLSVLHFTNGLGIIFGCLLLIPNVHVQVVSLRSIILVVAVTLVD